MMRQIIRDEHVKAKLLPVIAALNELDGEAVMYDPDVFEVFAGMILWCEGAIAILDPQSNEAYEARPANELVARVGLRVLTLNMQIDAENRLGQSVLDRYEKDLASLKFSGATVSQVQKLETEAKARSQAHRLNIVDLVAHKTLLEEFLSSGPDYDFSLLTDTEFVQP